MSKQNQVVLLKQMIQRAEKQIETARKMMDKLASGEDIDDMMASSRPAVAPDDGEVVEGVFDGVNMIGSDGRSYTVPANYASKSKLVEGDLLKLTIGNDGTFLYKQIGPIERKRLRGTLMQDDDTGEYSVMAQGYTYKVLSASVTYFKGEVGDEAIILVPTDKQSRWSAVENVIKEISDGHMGAPDMMAEKATVDLL